MAATFNTTPVHSFTLDLRKLDKVRWRPVRRGWRNCEQNLIHRCPHSLLTCRNMSSGFVPAGAGDDPPPEDDAWRQARQDVEATRERRKQDAEEAIDGKTLYEVLQQNKGKYHNARRSLTLCTASANVAGSPDIKPPSRKLSRNPFD